MPERTDGRGRHMHLLGIEERRAIDGEFQRRWYEHWRDVLWRTHILCPNLGGWPASVLDVGAGSGYGLDILRGDGEFEVVRGCDLLPLRAEIEGCEVSRYGDGEFDVVCAVDVIEHVENPGDFLAHCFRVAWRSVFLTTPNYECSQLLNEFHLREYTPGEFAALCLGVSGNVEFWTADQDWNIGRSGRPVVNMAALLRKEP